MSMMTSELLLKCKLCVLFSFVQFHTHVNKSLGYDLTPAPLVSGGQRLSLAVMATQNHRQVNAPFVPS